MIGLKAPGNYVDQFWSNKVSVLLCEEQKPQKFYDFKVCGPLGALIYRFKCAKLLQEIKANYGNMFGTYYFYFY